MLEILLQDLRFALRMLQKNPDFASSGVSAIASTPLDLIHARDGSAREAIFTPASGLFTGQCLICSLKGEVKKKHNSVCWSVSCFAASLNEQDLF
ncbi:MAG TPA: hypothetical protein VF749_18830 [Candidatus Acidoferrum sp.]